MIVGATIFAAVLGAVVGSFLNACIHRLPRGMSLSHPKRSFCPACEKTIPWSENLPVLSWVLLRGRCSSCGIKIPFRYFLVELLTAILFMAVWQVYGTPLALVYWAFVALLITATFIDFEHFIIPDEITWGGTILGCLFSFAFPQMMAASKGWMSGLWSLAGAAFGFVLLFAVVEGGKLAFGKIKHRFNPHEDFEWSKEGDKILLRLGVDTLDWMEIFSRESDKLTLEIEGACVADDREIVQEKIEFFHDRVILDGQSESLTNLQRITGKAQSVVIPREAMGFGDVKFIACIGAFLGWQAVIFTIFAASIIGSLAGVAGFFLARDKAGVRLPFGPFLAMGALAWLFGGRILGEWYFVGIGNLWYFLEF